MNLQIFQFLNGLAGKSEIFDAMIIFIAHYLPYWIVAGLFLFLIFGGDKAREFKIIALAICAGLFARFAAAETIRYFYYKPRPFAVLENSYQLLFRDYTASFPSGHATFLFALAAVIFFFHRKQSFVFFVGAALVGIARVIAGLHWPADILCGAVLGVFTAYVFCVFAKKRRII